MRIIKSTDAIAVEHPVFCWFGQPGIGKSSLGYSAKDPLLLDFDHGAHRAANRRDTLAIDSWADVTELMENKAALDPYATVIVDTVGRCLDMIAADIIASNPKMGRDGSLSLQGYGALKTRFRIWIAQLRAFGKDVALICHEKEERDGDALIIRPEITGGSYGEVMKVADFVAYLGMVGKNRVMDFNPTDKWAGKNPAGWQPFQIPPVGKAQTFIAELFEKGRAALGAISEESSKVARQVTEWRESIDTFTSPDEINRAIPETAKLPAIIAPQVKKILMDRAKALGFTWDAASKGFIEAPVAAAEPVGAGH